MASKEKTSGRGGGSGSVSTVLPSRGACIRLGKGEIGGKAQGLTRIQDVLRGRLNREEFPAFEVDIPWFWVICTEWFDRFMEQNNLYDIALSDMKDPHIANAFQKAEIPAELVEQLSRLIAEVQAPLAVRSSSLLEDALEEPFAGVYGTKMVPNNQFSSYARLKTLLEAVRFVYASTFFRDAKSYRQAMRRSHRDEKMAVMIQEVVGRRHGDRFYPNVSGVARSYNFYSFGHGGPDHGVVSLALGLGKTIVDGGRCWTYCPAYPRSKPPFGSTKELLTQTQTEFWSLNMGKIPSPDPIRETEYLLEGNLGDAEQDDVLQHVASTYDPQADRIIMGTGSTGPRVLDFAPLLTLNDFPLNDLVRKLLHICEEASGHPMEIEFAVNLYQGGGGTAHFGFLQVRPMFVSEDRVEVGEHELHGDHVLVASEQVLGNGHMDSLKDVVYVMPETFSAKNTWLIAAELDEMNRCLLELNRPYLLMVLGRLGTADPWLGIPVKWGQVSGAKVIVETISPEMNVDMSQGSHFFHNVTCLRVLYFSTDKTGQYPVRWEWLKRQKKVKESQFVRHVVLDKPLSVKVDGQSGRGVISYERADQVSD
jgi:hypothetical protein